MDVSQRQEQFSKAYVQAVAATAGYSCTTPVVDDDSVDVTIASKSSKGTIRSPRVEAQIKSWTTPLTVGEEWRYPLKIKNYDDLRVENVLVPRILVLVLVPADLDEWVELSHDETMIRNCGYWASLRGMGPTMNEATVTVPVPRAQQLTVAAVESIMDRVGAGGLP
jgi:hypothetical protein